MPEKQLPIPPRRNQAACVRFSDAPPGTRLQTAPAVEPPGTKRATEMEPLTPDEEKLLRESMEKARRTWRGFSDALTVIRDNRLYRATHAAFEDFCREHFGYGSKRASQVISAGEIVRELSTIVDVSSLPKNEAQARALAKVAPERRAEVWTQAQEDASEQGRAVTAADVERVSSPAPKPEKRPKREKRCPNCGFGL